MAVYLAMEFAKEHALRLSFVEPWTWAEFERSRQRIESYMERVHRDVDLIIDVRFAGKLIPKDAFSRLARSYAGAYQQLRRHIIVGAPQDLQDLLAAAERYYSALGGLARFICVNNLDEAHRILALPTA